MVQILNLFPVIYGFFPKAKAHNMLAMMLNPHSKGLGLINRFIDKEKTL
jgi:hypothetical protein